MELFNRPNFLYWLFIALIIPIEHLTLGKLWKRQENHRWTTGYATVFLPGALMIKRGHWDYKTTAALFVAVGIAGAIKVGLGQLNKSHEAESERRVWGQVDPKAAKIRSNSYLTM